MHNPNFSATNFCHYMISLDISKRDKKKYMNFLTFIKTFCFVNFLFVLLFNAENLYLINLRESMSIAFAYIVEQKSVTIINERQLYARAILKKARSRSECQQAHVNFVHFSPD